MPLSDGYPSNSVWSFRGCAIARVLRFPSNQEVRLETEVWIPRLADPREFAIATSILLRAKPRPSYLETVPPSTGRSMPVMKLLSSEARNTAADASSKSSHRDHLFEVVARTLVRCFSADMDHRGLRGTRADYVRSNATAGQLCGPGPDKRHQSGFLSPNTCRSPVCPSAMRPNRKG